MKKKILILLLMIILITLSNPQVYAQNVDISIKKDNNLYFTPDNAPPIYLYNIASGDSATYKLNMKNKTTELVEVYFADSEEIFSKEVTSQIVYKVSIDDINIIEGKINEVKGALISEFNPEETKQITIETKLDESAGNEYQQIRFNIKYYLEVRTKEDENSNSGNRYGSNNENINNMSNSENNSNSAKLLIEILPKTGQERIIYFILLILIAIILIFIAIMLLIIRRKEKILLLKENEEKGDKNEESKKNN